MILAIDSATPVAGVALMDEKKLIREEFSNYKKTHSESLMPMVDRVMRESQCRLSDLDGIAISIGPGSFTGLRIGLAAAKGLALGAGIPLVALSTLEVLAANVIGCDALICPILDARRNEVYGGLYLMKGFTPENVYPSGAYAPEEFFYAINEQVLMSGAECCIILGDAADVYWESIQRIMGPRGVKAPAHLSLPRACALASLGLKKLERGEIEDPLHLSPTYLRLSEAEIKRQKEKKRD